MRSKTPIVARSDAAATSPNPWSIAAGIRCVPIRPFVDAPQMKKLPASSRNEVDRQTSPRVRIGVLNGLPLRAGAG